MRSCITEFLDHRMEEIAQSLRGSNAAYSLAVEKSQFLSESIEPIISNKKGYHRLTRGNRPPLFFSSPPVLLEFTGSQGRSRQGRRRSLTFRKARRITRAGTRLAPVNPVPLCQPMVFSAGDCTNFREYFQLEMEAAAIMQRELYRQGYLDCVSLLVKLGLLTGREAPL